MELSAEQRALLFGDTTGTLSFRVFDGTTKNVLFDGAKSELWRLDDRATEVTLRVSPGRHVISLPKHAVAVVRGRVSGAVGPSPNVFVQAYDENLGAFTALGASVSTDATGSYRITYDPGAIPNGKDRPDLVVKAFSSLVPPVEIAISKKLFRAPASATVNLVRSGERWHGKTSFSSTYERISPLVGSTPLRNLDASQRASLASSAGLVQLDVDALSFADKLKTDFPPLTHDVAFGLLRRGLPGAADSFFQHPKSVIREELRAALDDNLIPQTYEATIETVVSSQWVPAAAAWALQPRTGEVCGLAEVLNEAGVLVNGTRQAFAQAYCAHEGTPSAFWDALVSLDATQKSRVQLALQHWSLTRGHKPLLSYLQQDQVRTAHPTLESLVTVTEGEWLGIVSQAGVGTPASIPGTDAVEKQKNYARLLAFSIAHAFPMKTFRARALQSSEAEIQAFFSSHPDFEFGRDRLSQQQGTVDTRVKAFERLYRVVPRFEPVKTLADAGYLSAHDIVQKGKSRFVSEMATLLGDPETAAATFDKASWQAGASSVLFAKYAAAANQVKLPVLPDLVTSYVPTPQDPSVIPDWTSLFGNPGGCACKHCASVLSASAYLVDLLQWLDGFASEVERPSGGKWSALDVLVGSSAADPPLLGRRPDLKRLELTCKAANTPLPYIDLANEILEVAVAARAGGASPDVNLPIATTYDAADLLAGPEVPAANVATHAAAWTAVSQAVYPLTQPVDLWAEETNAYLRYLGVSRPEIVETLCSSSDYEDLLAKSRLGVRALGYLLLQTSPAGGPPVEDAWGGFGEAAELSPVPVFLKRAGLSFEDMEELLSTRYVNGLEGNGAAGLDALALSEPEGCNPEEMTLVGLTAGHLARLHPFLRLCKRTGLSITEVDRTLAAFTPNQSQITIDAAMLQNVTQTRALAERLSLPITDVLCLYRSLDRWEGHAQNSPFRRAFLDRSVDSPEVFAFKAILEMGVASGSDTVAVHRSTFQRTLRISATDFDLLTDYTALAQGLFLPPSEVVAPASATLTHAIVSRLYAAATLARALRLSIRDFLVLRALAGSAAEPFSRAASAASLGSTTAFCRLVEDLRTGSLSVPEVQYVLRAIAPRTGGLAPASAAIEALRSDIEKSTRLIEAETEASEDVDGARTRALLAELLPAEAAALFGALRAGDGDATLFAPLAPFFPDAAALERDVAAPSPALGSAAERFSYVAKWLERRVRCERALVEKLAETHSLPALTMKHLLSTVIVSAAAEGRPALDDFLPARRGDAFGGENHATEWQSSTLSLLDRHARLLRGLGVAGPIPEGPEGTPAADMGEILWVYPSLAATHALHDLPRMPAALSDAELSDSRARFARLRTLVRRMALRNRLAAGPEALRLVLIDAPQSLAAAKATLAEQTGWERSTLDELAEPFGYLTAEGHVSEEALLRIERAVLLCRRLGLSAADAQKLLEIDHQNEVAVPTAQDQVELARRAAKAKVSPADWAQVARGVRDPFREKLRDALLGTLVPRFYGSTSEVYANLLIDPEMSPRQLTSRVVQATNSVQVFVQRSLLHLDDDVKLPAAAGKEWEWRKAYRVWEANRKVFLYPENWIDPALRDDKTPLFKELETRLAQGELTDEAAEDAIGQYLTGLAQIARLEVMAICDEADETGDLVATHVVARTRSSPHHWFHRRRTPLHGWLPWMPMSLDIEGEGVLLTVQNRHLHLFWPVTMVRPSDKQTPAPIDSEEPSPPQLRMEIGIAYSVYQNGKFSPRKLATSAPLRVEPARGEQGTTGISEQDISLVLSPSSVLQEGQIGVDVLVYHVIQSLDSMDSDGEAGAIDFESWQQDIAGRFIVDPCGPRWTTTTLLSNFHSDQSFSFADDYAAPLPDNCIVTPTGIQALDVETAPVKVPRPGFGKSASPIEILAARPGAYRLVAESSSKWPYMRYFNFVFEDQRRAFYVRIERDAVLDWHVPGRVLPGKHAGPSGRPGGQHGIAGALWDWSNDKPMAAPSASFQITDTAVIEAFDHPHVCEMTRRLAARGLPGLLGWKVDHMDSVQFREVDVSADYGGTVVPMEIVDFAYGTPFSTYNWELFFHVPVTIASRLNAEGRYEAAQKWLHFVFDPTGGPNDPGARRFWRFRPFYENHDLASIQKSLDALATSSSNAAEIKALVAGNDTAQATIVSLQQQITLLAADPFNPHAIARHRVLAFQKAVVMQYVDNLLDWGDALFRRDTLESMHEALSVYLLAADLLGPRPVTITHKGDPAGMTFDQLRSTGLDEFGNAALAVETIVPEGPPKGWKISFGGPPLPDARLYFCVPGNDLLVGYWDRVADRLFKLRNSMSIDGIVRDLPLFSPPIDPAILVRAAAAGVSLDKVLDSLAAPAPLFRFLRLHGKAVEFASHVAGLGQSLLLAIEKRDGESLGRLRQTHERNLLDAEREVRKGAVREGRQTLEGLRKQRLVVEKREEFYRTIQHRIDPENKALQNTKAALDRRSLASDMEIVAEIAAKVPQFSTGGAGAGGSPLTDAEIGGLSVAMGLSALARKARDMGDYLSTQAGELQTEAGYQRRSDEWNLQAELAKRELAQIDKQIAAQEIRIALAEREVENLDLRRSQSQAIEDVLLTKFSNTELYDWMVGEVAAEHYRAYQVAYDMAKKAERAYQLERGDDKATFIRFGAWDSLKRGLLAGERLLADLRALDAAYLSRTDREREITKHVSLAELAPAPGGGAPYLVALRDTGEVDNVEIPEWLLDADYPGHYFRRLKAVSVSVATVRSSLDGVQCDLTLNESRVRKSGSLDGGYAQIDPEDGRFSSSTQAIKALSTSTADDDAGLFQLDLRDEKLLPYEGQGVLGKWRVEVPKEQNRFPLHRISDVVLHLRYTARDAGAALREVALAHAKGPDANGTDKRAQRVRTMSARAEAAEGWARFLAGESDPSKNRLEISLKRAGFLSFFGTSKVKVVGVTVSTTFSEKYEPPNGGAATFQICLDPPNQTLTGDLPFRSGEPSVSFDALTPVDVTDTSAPWILWVANGAAPSVITTGGLLKPDALEDLWLTFTYEVA